MIQVENLTKTYGKKHAIENLNFTIEPGIIYGLLGPNGAGKSTTMNILTGCLTPSSGRVTIDSYDIHNDSMEAKKLIGYLPEQPPLYMNMTPFEYLNFVAQAKYVKKDKIKDQIEYALETVKIGKYSNRLISSLSKGYQQRVGIAQAIIGNPKIIILDEPTVGLDPHQLINIRNLILDLGKTHTIILSSHNLAEVQAVCQSVIVISKGKIVANNTLENLNLLFNGNVMRLLVKGPKAELDALLSSLAFISSYDIEMTHDKNIYSLKLSFDSDDDIREQLFYAFSNAKIPILDINTEKADLEEIFIQLTSSNQSEDKQIIQ